MSGIVSGGRAYGYLRGQERGEQSLHCTGDYHLLHIWTADKAGEARGVGRGQVNKPFRTAYTCEMRSSLADRAALLRSLPAAEKSPRA